MQMNPQQELVDFISKINDVELDAEIFPLSKLAEQYPLLNPMSELVLCIPASSAPVGNANPSVIFQARVYGFDGFQTRVWRRAAGVQSQVQLAIH